MTRVLARFTALFLLLASTAAVFARDASIDPWETEIARFEAADRAAPPPPGGVVFVGSSSIRLWSTLADDFAGTRVLNRGFGGSRIADATRLAARIVLPYRPRLVVLYAGDNDLAEGRTPPQVLADVEAFIASVHHDAPTTPVVFVSIKPSPARAALLPAMREANALVRAYAGRTRGVRYVDVFEPMLGADGAPRAELFGPDRLHMNARGYALWTRIIAPELRR
ncbi:lysophospholipase L1-like esterase [Dokdonella fugitiva]|uniref:Lysophospholipase L1-like esterase n=1 Tax=Dokdonella fugitiva TaxID=328517 RepID=A0A839F018_9GAMM|nr:SGNH/GDSL hydrolase family protein [Dokdonella fugitiva]MBA8886490.1 lysophospholipase L1-like esterase [Dokdonella fugitiva]